MKHLCLLIPLALPTAAMAEAPDLKTPSPVLYLADNLDEPDKLGYCLDTLGRGASDRAQVHSCKPQGGDVQFQFDVSTGRIQSATFDDVCLDVTGGQFALTDCSDVAGQKFQFDAVSGEIKTSSDPSTCLTSAAESRQAGPFMSRSLALTDCASTPTELKSWVQG